MDKTIYRQWLMMREIPDYPRKIDASALLQKLGVDYQVDLRTIQRDLKQLSTIFPFEGDGKRPQGWYWPKGISLDVHSMRPSTALAFNLAEDFLKLHLPVNAIRELEPWFKQAKSIKASEFSPLKRWKSKIHIMSANPIRKTPTASAAIHETVYDALYSEKKLKFTYQSATGKNSKKYLVSPHGLIVQSENIYLASTVDSEDFVRTFLLSRMKSATLSNEPALSRKFKFDEFIASNPLLIPRGKEKFEIKLKVTSTLARYFAEGPVFEGQKFERIDELYSILSGTAFDSAQLRNYILQFGEEITVLEPDWLNAEIVAKLSRSLKNHQTAKSR